MRGTIGIDLSRTGKDKTCVVLSKVKQHTSCVVDAFITDKDIPHEEYIKSSVVVLTGYRAAVRDYKRLKKMLEGESVSGGISEDNSREVRV